MPIWYSTSYSVTVYLKVSVFAERDSPTESSIQNSNSGNYLLYINFSKSKEKNDSDFLTLYISNVNTRIENFEIL